MSYTFISLSNTSCLTYITPSNPDFSPFLLNLGGSKYVETLKNPSFSTLSNNASCSPGLPGSTSKNSITSFVCTGMSIP